MNTVTITRKAHEAEVPSIAGIGGYLLQDAVTVIRTHTGAEITVTGSRSMMSGVDVSSDAPAGDHDTIVAYWQAEAERWAASAAHLERADVVTYTGGVVEASGFTSETFASGVEKAVRIGTMHMIPSGHGSVLVLSARTGARYVVTRTHCSCPGHHSHGHCYHRAAVLYCADVWGVDVNREHLLGFDPHGWPVTETQRVAQLSEVA